MTETTPKTIEQVLREDWMRKRDNLVVATVGGNPMHGSLNEYHACRLNKGDRIRFERHRDTLTKWPMEGEATVRMVTTYDGFVIHADLDDGTQIHLFAECDLIEATHDTGAEIP